MTNNRPKKVGAVLIVGAGISGMQSALDLADSGFKVYLVDTLPTIGGVMSQLDKTFPTNDCAMCIMAPKLVETVKHPNIELITNVDIKTVNGQEGNFDVEILKRSRFIKEDKCTGCGLCAQWCPVEAVNEFNEGLTERSAVYVRYPQAAPLVYTIDRTKCIGCGLCDHLCAADAVDYQQKDETDFVNVGAIILSPGFDIFKPEVKKEFGYGKYKNVVTSMEFERILSATGPTKGIVMRPSDGKIPENVAFIQCVGSRDEKLNANFCSSVCCVYAIKEAIIAQEHTVGLQSHIFFMDIRAIGKEFEDYYNRSKTEFGINFIRSRVSHIEEDPDTSDLILTYSDNDMDIKQERFGLVVLSVGLHPPKGAEDISKIFGVELNEFNFCKTNLFEPLDTNVPGIYVSGTFSSPKDIPDTVAQASGAAARASSLLASERNKLVTKENLIPERDVTHEVPRIGVFVCHCGINIGGVVDVPGVVEYAKDLPGVAYVENNLYTCSQDAQERIKEKVDEHNLNRVVVASCTPRTHEPLFRDTIGECGLNPYLFEMVNIRDQCSWVHMHEPIESTEKAKDLVRMGVAKARLLTPLKRPLIEINHDALVIGGGMAGMTAALELARQGFKVHLVEKEPELGGNFRKIFTLPDGTDPRKKTFERIDEVIENDNIQVYTDTELVDVSGYIGNFESKLLHQITATATQESVIKHGVIIAATGAEEYKPTEYLYGESDRVITQFELERMLTKDIDPKNEDSKVTKLTALASKLSSLQNVVMIQCVGARDDEHPNCSRVCCVQALKNALLLKSKYPDINIYILYKDVRTYGLHEDLYRRVSELGVHFIRYDDDNKPKVRKGATTLKVSLNEPLLDQKIKLIPDLVVISAGVVPNKDNDKLSKMLKVPLTKDKFFLEAHMKLRPLDFATDGIFLCGLAHSPKSIDEALSQATGAAARAATILTKSTIEGEGIVSSINEEVCKGCGICVLNCPYKAIELDEEANKAKVTEILCKGCGVCVASCPQQAVRIGFFDDEQILAQVRALADEKVES